MGGHVAGEAGVGVLPPGSPEPVRFLVDDKVVVARFAELDGGENAGHPGANDGDAQGCGHG